MCPAGSLGPSAFHSLSGCTCGRPRVRRLNSQWIDFSSGSEPTGTDPGGVSPPPSALPVLLRKEVIQPHLPVRLPCYDFVPIADPTFDSSLPYGLGRRLRVLPTFVT